MRKIINSAFVSLDGVTEDPSSWATFDPDAGDEAARALRALDGGAVTLGLHVGGEAFVGTAAFHARSHGRWVRR